MKSKDLNPKVKRDINQLIKEDWCRMFEFVDGKVKLLLHHYKYLNPYNDAKRVLIGKSKRPKDLPLVGDQFLYLTEQIK